MLTGASGQEAYLGGIRAMRADLSNADLSGSNLEEAVLEGANFESARLSGTNLRKARLKNASLQKADLSNAMLSEADLSDCDARQANLLGATLAQANLTGARIAGITGTGAPVADVQVAWLDTSRSGDGSERLSNGKIPQILSGSAVTTSFSDDPSASRYIGPGDEVSGASFQFAPNARVRVDGLLERCELELGNNAEIIVGETGVLAECIIRGSGRIVVHGKFYEAASPGIIGPTELVVTAGGVLVAAVQQDANLARFAFEQGSRLRMKVLKPTINA